MRRFSRIVLTLVLLALPVASCGGAPSSSASAPQAVAARPAQIDTATTQTSQQGLYRISYTASEDPVPVSKLHTWTVHIATPSGAAVDGATVSVDGGMPEHNHGMPTQPLVAPAGNGDYRVEGMKFQMPGWWTVTVQVAVDGQQDRATFNLLLN